MSRAMTRRQQLAVMWIGCLFASSAAAQTIHFGPGAAPAGAVWVTPFDNPPLRVDGVPLGGSEEAVRSVEEDLGDVWGFTEYELQMLNICWATDDPLCVALQTHSDRGLLNVWPYLRGGWVAPQTFSVESHGLRIGHQASTVALRKYGRYGEFYNVAAADVRLDPDTIVVPINVVVVLPSEAIDPTMRGFMENWANEDYYRVLFDDLWRPDIQRSYYPGDDGGLEFIGGHWDLFNSQSELGFTEPPGQHQSVPMPSPPGTGPSFLRPDDIWVQCGIQFRLASIVVVEATTERSVHFYDTTKTVPELCDDWAASVYTEWEALAETAPSEVLFGAYNSNARNIYFSYLAQHQSCFVPTNGRTVMATGNATIPVGTQQGSNTEFSLVHELGHVLGLDHGGVCSDAVKNVMCANGDFMSSNVIGCHLWDQDPGAPLPVNCAPVSGEGEPTAAMCSRARSVAEQIAQNAAYPVQFEPTGAGGIGWQSTGGMLEFNLDNFTEGTASLRAGGGGWRMLSSPGFRTADWLAVGTRLALDVFVDPSQPNPYWVGSLDLSVDVPAAGLNSAQLGHVELTPLAPGQWSTVEVDVPANVFEALLGDFPAGVIHVAVNTPMDAPALLLDNLRFSGTVQDRTVFHQGPGQGGATSPLFSFESLPDWSSDTGNLAVETELITQGSAALAIEGAGYTVITSRQFSGPSEVGTATGQVTVDLFVPDPQPNPYWVGALQLYATCGTHDIFNAYVGQAELTYLFFDEFNTLSFTLPQNVVDALNDDTAGCSLSLALNVNNGSGWFVLDNLAFR